MDGDSKKQQELLDLILRHKWSARRAEQFVIAHKQGAKDSKKAAEATYTENKETKAISKKLKTNVIHRKMAKGGRLIISYKDDKDYKRITDLLK